MYSDTRNLLTGVLSSRETLEVVAATFLEALVWLLIQHTANQSNKQKKKVFVS